MSDLPLLLPGVLIAIVASFVAGPRLGRALSTTSLVGGSVVFSFGLILAATLTPQAAALGSGIHSGGTCDLTITVPTLEILLAPTDMSLNILLFAPLGMTLGLVPRSSLRTVFVTGALLLPFMVEWIQLVVPVLDRACQANDIVANEIGLVLGLAIGWTGHWLTERHL